MPEPDTLDALDLGPVASRLPRDRPFTRRDATRAGLTRAGLERLVRDGLVRRVLHGVYADVSAVHDQVFRARAVGLTARGDTVATGRTAAWLHGVPVEELSLAGEPPVPTVRRGRRTVSARQVVQVGETLLTSPLRTLLDLARDDEPAVAVLAADRMLADGTLTHAELLAGLVAAPHDPRVCDLLAQADARARGPAESVLRLRWHCSGLPTPVPGLVVPGRAAAVRLTLGVPARRFGAVLRSAAGGPEAGTTDLARLGEAGWWVVLLPDDQVLHAPAERLQRHLEREFHQALLREVG